MRSDIALKHSVLRTLARFQAQAAGLANRLGGDTRLPYYRMRRVAVCAVALGLKLSTRVAAERSTVVPTVYTVAIQYRA